MFRYSEGASIFPPNPQSWNFNDSFIDAISRKHVSTQEESTAATYYPQITARMPVTPRCVRPGSFWRHHLECFDGSDVCRSDRVPDEVRRTRADRKSWIIAAEEKTERARREEKRVKGSVYLYYPQLPHRGTGSSPRDTLSSVPGARKLD